MTVKVNLKNSRNKVVLDEKTVEKLKQDKYLKTINFFDNLREHSSGYAFFQKNWKQKDGAYRNETIYLHKYLCEKLIKKPNNKVRWFVRFINGNTLDCRIENLEWSTFSNLVRNTRKIKNSTGYRGVVKQGRKYYSYIYVNRRGIPLGSFNTAEAAAEAYNKKSKELFGVTNTLNEIKKGSKIVVKAITKAKPVAKKATTKKVVAKARPVAKKKVVAKKVVAKKKVAAKKPVVKKVVAKKKMAAKKPAAKKVVAKKKVAAKKPVAKKGKKR